MTLSDQKHIVKLEKKIVKKFSEAVASELRGLPQSAIEDTVFRLSKDLEQVEEAKRSDEKLQSLREEIKEVNGTYEDAKRAIRLKLQFLLALYLEKYGEELSNK